MTSPDFRPSSWHERLLLLTLGLVLVTVLTFPLISRVGNAGPIDTAEGRLSIWHTSWVAHALVTTPHHLLDANVFFPNSGTLAYSDLSLTPGALGAAMLAGTGNSLATVNAAVALSLLITFLAMWALVRRLVGSTGAGIIAATAYTFCPFVNGAAADVPLLMIFSFPLLGLALQRAVDRPSVVSAAAISGALVLTALSCGAYAVPAIVVLITIAATVMRGGTKSGTTCAAAVAVAIAILAPLVVHLAHVRYAAELIPALRANHSTSIWTTMRAYAASNAFAHRWWLSPLAIPSHDRWFPGIALVLLAGVGVVTVMRNALHRHRSVVIAYGSLAAAAFVGSMIAAAMSARSAGAATSVVSLAQLPSAFAIVVTFALAVVAGVGARAIGQLHPAWLIGVLALTAADVFAPWPITIAPTVPAAYRLLATLPRGPVIDLPVAATTAGQSDQSAVLWHSTFDWQPMVNGEGDLLPVTYLANMRTFAAFPDAASFELAHRLGVRYVVFRMADYKGGGQQALFARLPSYERYLRRVTAADDVWLYEIVEWPAG